MNAFKRRLRCTHLPDDLSPPTPSSTGCEDCLAAGEHEWVHLRLCQACGHVGCCDNSPRRHATAHHDQSEHPLIRSFEPHEHWWYCYPDRDLFFVEGSPDAPSHPG